MQVTSLSFVIPNLVTPPYLRHSSKQCSNLAFFATMQVARAAGTPSKLPGSSSIHSSRTAASYAPLYLSSSLRHIAFDIEELEGIALDRLKVLKAAETARSNASIGQRSAAAVDAIRTSIRAAERAAGLNIPPPGNPTREDRVLKDEASHFLLRLALCKTHEHRNWLLSTEHDLFTARLEGAGAEFALQAIEKADGPTVRLASASDLERFRQELDAVARGPGRMKGDSGTNYYTVAFEQVPALIRYRRVFLDKGMAYVPERNVLDIVSSQFRSKLSHALVTASKAVGLADGDQRMRPILESIRQHYAMEEQVKGFDPAASIERINLTQLNESLPAMPLCMVNMMTRLREQHHLRYAGRLQLGVFLKGCGLNMDESLRFWRTEFGKGAINSDKFEKSYAYNIRHHYGREGKRRNLAPFPCMRIINDRPGPGEHNGCPYREFEETRLKQALRSIGTDPNAIPVIAAKAKEGNFQTACGICFASSQPGIHAVTETGMPEYIPTHPNEYFIEARKRRFAPNPDVSMLDADIDEEEMLMAAAAVESQNSDATPKKSGSDVDRDNEVVNPRTPLEKKDVNCGNNGLNASPGVCVPDTPVQATAHESPVIRKRNDDAPELQQPAKPANLQSNKDIEQENQPSTESGNMTGADRATVSTNKYSRGKDGSAEDAPASPKRQKKAVSP